MDLEFWKGGLMGGLWVWIGRGAMCGNGRWGVDLGWGGGVGSWQWLSSGRGRSEGVGYTPGVRFLFMTAEATKLYTNLQDKAGGNINHI